MGKKYIIELEDKPFHKEDGDFLYRAKGFNSLVFDMTGISKLTPYTEPDLEQVRKEAYDKGYDDAAEEIGSDEQAIADKAYKNGLSDAWEAARKVVALSTVERRKVFGSEYMYSILEKHTASEAIEKLKQEQNEIQVGDEVITDSGKAVVTGVGPVHFEYDNADGSHGFDKVKNVKKTGRHFPEIAAVFEKMREES